MSFSQLFALLRRQPDDKKMSVLSCSTKLKDDLSKQNNKSLWYQNDIKITPKWSLKVIEKVFQSFPMFILMLSWLDVLLGYNHLSSCWKNKTIILSLFFRLLLDIFSLSCNILCCLKIYKSSYKPASWKCYFYDIFKNDNKWIFQKIS